MNDPSMTDQGRILFIDDEDMVRDLAAMMLERLGYTVSLADSGAAGVAMFREHAAQIALVIVDVNMPGMDGLQCVQQLIAIDPRVRVVLSSGYGRDAYDLEPYRHNIRGFLQKPFVLRQLSDVLLEARAD